ncbi:MAG TPA: flagellar motor protein [Aeromonadales bacterium]|nr:flagellar motor protein [Aeromonadales bacterium]
MKLDSLSILGLFLAFLSIAGGQILEGGGLDVLMNGPAAIIVIGGTLGAALIQTPLRIFSRSLKIFPWVLFNPAFPFQQSMDKLVDWSASARREGLLGLEELADTETDEFTRRGLNLLVDGSEPEAIRNALLTDLDLNEHKTNDAAKVFEAMGGYSPTMGIIGAVLGLIHVMGNLTEPEMLGQGIATAFVATIYGVGFANLFLIPVAHKLKHINQIQARYREMIIEGLVGIAEGENPRVIENRLVAYLNY